MINPSAKRVAALFIAKNLPKNVERYVQEGLDSGMDESKAWAIAWSRYCKYKEPGSPHCQMETSEYLPNQGKKKTSGEPKVGMDRFPPIRSPRGWRPPEGDGECPREILRRNLKDFEDSIRPVVGAADKALRAIGYEVHRSDTVSDMHQTDGHVYQIFEIEKGGKKVDFTLKFSGEFEEEEVEKSKQFDADDSVEWTETVVCPPRRFESVSAINDEYGREVALNKNRITSSTLGGAIWNLGLS